MVRRYFAPALVCMDLEEIGAVINKLQGVRYGHPITKAVVEIAFCDALAKFTSYRFIACSADPIAVKSNWSAVSAWT